MVWGSHSPSLSATISCNKKNNRRAYRASTHHPHSLTAMHSTSGSPACGREQLLTESPSSPDGTKGEAPIAQPGGTCPTSSRSQLGVHRRALVSGAAETPVPSRPPNRIALPGLSDTGCPSHPEPIASPSLPPQPWPGGLERVGAAPLPESSRHQTVSPARATARHG